MSMRWQWIAGSVVLVTAALGCKSDAEICHRQIADCVRRCDDTGASPAPEAGMAPENTMSACEKACQHCHPETGSAPPSTGRPTITGTEPEPK
jgi:hypothetical protein